MKKSYLLFLLFSLLVTSCVSKKDVRYLQPSESLTINEEGLIPYNVQEYRVTKNDVLVLNIVTTPKGDAAQFYSSYNTSSMQGGSGGAGGGATDITSQGGNSQNGSGNRSFYFNGLKVDSKGDINVFGVGYVKAEGRTLEEIGQELQTRVNENFLDGKSEVRINTDGITFYILGDLETTNLTGAKTVYLQRINILEALATEGGLNRTIDRKSVVLQRKYPEGIKRVQLDLTKEDVMNSPYFWLQNGDMILLNTNGKSISGFGKEPLQTLTTGVSLLTTVISIYLIFTKL